MPLAMTRDRVRTVGRSYGALLRCVLATPVAPVDWRLRRCVVAGGAAMAHLPVVRLESLVGSDFPDAGALRLRAIARRAHNASIYEHFALALITRIMRPRRAFEIGTLDGRGTLAIADNAPDGAEIFTLNLPPTYDTPAAGDALSFDERLATHCPSGGRAIEAGAQITQLYGNSMEFDFAPYRPCQLIFIDGGHARHVVAADTASAMSIIDREHGVILWHDATKYGVRPVLGAERRRGLPISLIEGTTIGVLRFEGGRAVSLPF